MAGFFDNILADPGTAQGMLNAGTFGGLQALGAALAQAGALRPMGTPGPTLADAFTAYGTGRQRGLLSATQAAQMQRKMRQQGLLSEARSDKPDDQISPAALAYRGALAGLPEGVRTLADDEQLPGLAIKKATEGVRPMTAAEVAAAGLRPGTAAYVNDFTGNPNVVQQSDFLSPDAEAQRVRIAAASRAPAAPIILGPGQVAFGRDGRPIATGPTMREQPVAMSPGGTLVNPVTGQVVYSTPANPITMSPGQQLVDPITGRARAAVPPRPEAFTLAPGQTRYGPDGQPVATMPRLMAPEEEEQAARIRAAGAPRVSIDQRAESEFEKGYGGGLAKDALATLEAANTAQGTLETVQRMRALEPQIRAGMFGPGLVTITGFAQAIGARPETLRALNLPESASPGEMFQAMSNRLTMGMIGPGGIPANNFTDEDRRFAQMTVPQLFQRPETISQGLDALEKISGRAIEAANSWNEARQRGYSYEKWQTEWRQHVKANPLFAAPPPDARAPRATDTASPPPNPLPPPERRVRDQVYDLPSGRFRWKGNGWEAVR